MYKKSSRAAPIRPPRLAERLLAWLSPRSDRDALLGDLAEELCRHQLPARGAAGARRWYWGQALRSLLPGLRRPRSSVLPEPAIAAAGAAGRRHRGDGPMSELWHDLRFGVRMLRRSPTFTVVTVLTLALAIGFNSAIFSMVSALLLNDLPIQDRERLVAVRMQHPARGLSRQDLSLADFLDLRDRLTAFDDIGAMRRAAAVLTGGEQPTRVTLGEVTANLFALWGTPPARGRGFAAGEDVPGAPRVALLSHGSWQRRFGGAASIIGRSVRLDGFETLIVGIMPAQLEFGDVASIEIWRPLPLAPDAAPRDRRDLYVNGRLAAGVTIAQAERQVAAAMAAIAEDHPDTHRGWQAEVRAFDSDLVDDSFWTILTLLHLTVAAVLLIACSNVATMMLARAAERGREMALRAALGAGRRRIMRQLLTECALLSLAAGALGLLVTRGMLRALVWIAGDTSGASGFLAMLEVDGAVLLFTLAVALLAPLFFGFVPALQSVRQNLRDALSAGGSRSASGGRGAQRGRRFLVGTQVALALMLMVVAGLLIRSMVEIQGRNPGYDPDAILTVRLELPAARYGEEHQQRRFFAQAIERVRARPEVTAAGWLSARPIADPPATASFRVAGQAPPADGEPLPWAERAIVDPGYLETMQLPLIRGRALAAYDDLDAAPVAMVNRELVERYWPDGDAVGRRLQLAGGDGRWLEVVGVLGNLERPSLSQPRAPQILIPLAQNMVPALALITRPRGDMATAADALRQAVWAIDPEQPVADVRTMRRILDDGLGGTRALLAMFTSFAAFALLLAATGLYGVVSFTVARRTRELGIRMALGARRREIRGLVMRQSARLVLAGIACGLLGGAVLNQILASGVAGVARLEPLTYGSVTAVLVLVAVLATLIPAVRATRLDPAIALRCE